MKITRLILFILHLGILFLLLCILLNAYIPPKVFPWFNLLSLGFPGLIIGYFLLILFWIFSSKKIAFIFLVWSLAFVYPIKRWINFSSKSKEPTNLTVVSLNTKGVEFGEKNIEDYINSKRADIVFLQEDRDAELNFSGLKRVKNVSVVSLYSKYKVINNKVLISGNYDTFNSYADLNDIEIKGRVFRFINVYLQPFKFNKQMLTLDGIGEKDQEKLKNVVRKLIPIFKAHQEQVEIIRKEIETSPYPVILGGDFNAVPNSYEYYYLKKGLNDAFVEVGRGSSTSFHDYKFPLRIDYIFASDSVKPTGYQVDRAVKISDHFPIIATFFVEK